MRDQYSQDGWDIGVVGILDELEQAYVERDSLKEQVQEWMEGSAQLQVKLDEAVLCLEPFTVDEWPIIEDVPGSSKRCVMCAVRGYRTLPTHSENCPKAKAADFLAGLSTVTPEDWAGHLRERAEGGGKTEEEMRKKYGLAPRCERVSVCCGSATPGDGTDRCGSCDSYLAQFKCAYHGCAWPDGEKECPSR